MPPVRLSAGGSGPDRVGGGTFDADAMRGDAMPGSLVQSTGQMSVRLSVDN